MEQCLIVGEGLIDDEGRARLEEIIRNLLHDCDCLSFAFRGTSEFIDCCYDIVNEQSKEFLPVRKIKFAKEDELVCVKGEKERLEKLFLLKTGEKATFVEFDCVLDFNAANSIINIFKYLIINMGKDDFETFEIYQVAKSIDEENKIIYIYNH